ncbi:hypothetical protein M427DRAFT_133235 [Gonapodya prolifera JEL478]|uniref:Uncharacterized protein n=1 Tax=Gonapodya prolifera (strain JEL478) TaxID=1344416 RepID=A0A139AME3_GONPJ|nr:hypothetical protein M427DRAFT_133235 [Gonapodya prolifera JEL478]|eukprot:KXS17734.1 hypothetical protein M427DRAFT_133235 [Gonapodya prolifera JEL478]
MPVRPLAPSLAHNALKPASQTPRDPQESAFHYFLRVAGLHVPDSANSNDAEIVLAVNPALFRHSLVNALIDHNAGQHNAAQEFLDGFIEWAQDEDLLRKSLQPLHHKIESDSGNDGSNRVGYTESASSGPNPSLLYLLLSVDILQTRLSKYILENIVAFGGSGEDGGGDSPPSSHPSPAILCLRDLRTLATQTRLADPDEVADALLRAIESTSGDIRREAVAAVGDVVGMGRVKAGVATLTNLLDADPAFRPAALEALGNMGLTEGMMSDLRVRLLETLRDPDLATLPLTLRFVLQQSGGAGRGDKQGAEELISSLREHLDADVMADLVEAGEQREAEEASGRKGKGKTRASETGLKVSEEVLVFDQLRGSLRASVELRDAVMAVIGKVDEPGHHTTLDVLLLILNRSLLRKKVDALIVRKIQHGHFTPELLRRAVERHAAALRPHVEQVVGIVEALVRGGMSEAAGEVAEGVWKGWGDYERQELMHSLVVHAGSGHPTDVDCSLRLILHLARADSHGASRFAVFVKNLLDQLDSMTLRQVGLLFEALAVLTVPTENDQTTSAVGTEVMIALTKQLSHPLDRYRRIGVAAGCALVKHWGSSELATGLGSEDLSKSPLKETVEVLEMLKRCSRRSMSALTLASDELSYLISCRNLFLEVTQWIQEHFVGLLDEFAWTQDELDKHCSALGENENENFLKTAMWDGLISQEDGFEQIGFPFYPLAVRPESATCGEEYTACGLQVGSVIAPLGRLYFACGAAKNEVSDGHLLLGAIMWEKRDISEIKVNYGIGMLEAACTSLFNNINWFREVINAFSIGTDDKGAVPVVSRVKHLVKLESLLDDLIRATPTWCPAELQETQTSGHIAPVSMVIAHSASLSEKERKERDVSGVSEAGTSSHQVEPLEEDDQDGDSDLERPSYSSARLPPKRATTKTDPGRKTVRRSPTGTKVNKRVTALRLDSEEEEDKNVKAKKVKTSVPQLKSIKQLAPILRDLSLDVFSLLRFQGKAPSSGTGNNVLEFAEGYFLLKDLSRKVRSKLCTPSNPFGRRSLDAEESLYSGSLLAKLSASDVVSKLVPVLPYLLSLLERIVNELQSSTSQNEESVDSSSNKVENKEEWKKMLNESFLLVLQILHDLVNWQGFKLAQNGGLMKKLLKAFTSRIAWPGQELDGSSSADTPRPHNVTATQRESNPSHSQPNRRTTPRADLVHAAFKYLSNCDAALSAPETAVRFLRTLDAMIELFPDELRALDRDGIEDDRLKSMGRKVWEMSRKYLTLDWAESVKLKATDVEYLLDRQFQGVPVTDALDQLSTLVDAMDALVLADADTLSKQPALTRETYPTYVKVVLREMTKLVPSIESDKTVAFSSRLRFQKQLVEAFHALTGHTRRFEDTPTLHSLLRGSRTFLDAFAKKAMPAFTRHFKKESADILDVLSILQKGTRIVQQVCGHGKSGREERIMAVVPMVKKTLEGLLYQVKIMLAENNKAQDFWVGNLKHRALDGTEISSQIPVEHHSDSADESSNSQSQTKSKRKSKSKNAQTKTKVKSGEVLNKRKRRYRELSPDANAHDSSNDDDVSKRPRLSATQVVDSDEGMSDAEVKHEQMEEDEVESIFGKGERDELEDEQDD